MVFLPVRRPDLQRKWRARTHNLCRSKCGSCSVHHSSVLDTSDRGRSLSMVSFAYMVRFFTFFQLSSCSFSLQGGSVGNGNRSRGFVDVQIRRLQGLEKHEKC